MSSATVPYSIPVSQDYGVIESCVAEVLAKGKDARVPESHVPWINHLMGLKRLQAVDRGICRHLTIEEIRGLAVIEAVARKTDKNARACPRCKHRTESLYTCEKCGMRLS